jgi:polysaccharide export outer membrane protein
MHILPPMKAQNVWFVRLNLLLIAALLSLGLAGCETPDYSKAMKSPGQDITGDTNVARLHIGDTVTITLTGVPDEPPPQEKPIKEDGSITLPDIGRVQAAGKTAGELEDLIHKLYVPAIYRHLNVTVKTSNDRVYYVRGEVRSPNRQIYVGQITVTKAITSAGDFTDFANRKKVFLIRANGQRFKLNVDAILNGDAPDPPVYPGDQIEVARRIW